jgi:DNA-binding MarR family transcriptional regulator
VPDDSKRIGRGGGAAGAAGAGAALPERASDASLRALTGYRLTRAFMVTRGDVGRVLEPFGLRMLTYTALSMVADNPGLSQSQLAAGMAIERPNLVPVLDTLEARALLSRDRVPTDRRVYALNVTAEGARLLAAATRALVEREARRYAVLSPEERALFKTFLQRIEEFDPGRS